MIFLFLADFTVDFVYGFVLLSVLILFPVQLRVKRGSDDECSTGCAGKNVLCHAIKHDVYYTNVWNYFGKINFETLNF